jgi:hypothetical protein
MIDIALAHKFTNSPLLNQECTPFQNFGGGNCEPFGFEKEIFNLINDFRLDQKNSVILNRLKEWRDSPGSGRRQDMVYLDFDNDGVIDILQLNGG